jgi:hypothetical protein
VHVAKNGAALSRQVPFEIAGQAKAQSFVNLNLYTEATYYQPLSTPLQPARLCRTSTTCVPNWGPAADDLWRAAMGLANNAVSNRTTGECASNCTYLGGGIPVTANVDPSPGTDGSAVLCLGGGDSFQPPWTLMVNGSPFVRPDGQQIQGNCWEVWQLRPDLNYNPNLPVSPSYTQWMISWGSHRTGFISQLSSTPDNTYGHQLDTLSGQYCPRSATGEWKCGGMTDALAQTWFGPDVLQPGAVDSTTYEVGWGVTAAETPLLTDVVQQQDCQNVLDGAATDLGRIQLQYTRYAGAGLHTAWWPAGGSDGDNGHMAVVEGMRLYLPASVQMPTGLPYAAQVLFRTIRK